MGAPAMAARLTAKDVALDQVAHEKALPTAFAIDA
jgi:hypothetical protein